MSHADAPLTPAGRLRLINRCATRPTAHIAAEAGVSRQCLSKWKNRYDTLGEATDGAALQGVMQVRADLQEPTPA